MFITTHPLAVLAIIAGLLAPLFAPSLTFAVLPSNEQWREGLINQHVGYGTVTGGQGTTLCEVTNLNDSGAGSLRACAHFQSNRWIVFRVNGTINLTSETVNPGSNVTIDGRGVDITISGRAFWVADVSNVIFENLKFDNMTGDGIDIRFLATRIWIDHVTTGQNFGDEAIDIACKPAGSGTTGVTISWSKFSAIPAQEGPLLFSVYQYEIPCNTNDVITLHHNYFDQPGRRQPVMLFAKVHAFNNYHKNTQTCASPPCMAVDVRSDGQYYSENEIFECPSPYCDYSGTQSVNGRWPRITTRHWVGTTDTFAPANMRLIGQWSVTGQETYDAELNPGTIFNPSSFYSYTPDVANATLRTKIINNAGWQNVTGPTVLAPPENLRVIQP